MKEIWKDIYGYEGFYSISSHGNVMSVRKGKLLKKNKNTSGYYQVCLCVNSDRKWKLVHKIVAEMFLKHVYHSKKEVVDHIDEDKTNNKVSNLRLCSQRFNLSRKKGGSSDYVGVSWVKERNTWRASIRINGKLKTLGTYKKEIDASNAYQEAVKALQD